MTISPLHILTGPEVIHSPIPGGATMAIRRFLIIHFTAGASAQSSINWWKNPKAKGTSAHIVIDRDGTIYQCRPFNRTAGHAGSSKWKDPKTGILYHGLNACSIGIELANAGDNWKLAGNWTKLPPVVAYHKHGGPERKWEDYPEPQIAALEALTLLLFERYNLDDLIGHEDISRGRKTDPGPAFTPHMIHLRTRLRLPSKIPTL